MLTLERQGFVPTLERRHDWGAERRNDWGEGRADGVS